MKDKTDSNLHRVIHISYEMLELADHGDRFRTDTGCGALYGILRDFAYKVRKMAERELQVHRNNPTEAKGN